MERFCAPSFPLNNRARPNVLPPKEKLHVGIYTERAGRRIGTPLSAAGDDRSGRALRACSGAMLPPGFVVRAQEKATAASKSLTLTELMLDSTRKVRHCLGGDLPDAVQNGKPKPKGSRASGIHPYDATGAERRESVTLEPSGNVASTLDMQTRQVATFVATRGDPEPVHCTCFRTVARWS
jgi:hypothetical protein